MLNEYPYCPRLFHLERVDGVFADNADTVEGRIVGVGKTIRIRSIHVHYDLAVPSDAVEATERALAVHVQGCPAHQSVKDAIRITWAATVRAGERTVTVREESQAA